ncbi:MAG TPA: integrase core domain-containing protein [Gemmataceae bacterium]|nr:integrase core domain-containing protein [Gemmataceae bacterium]
MTATIVNALSVTRATGKDGGPVQCDLLRDIFGYAERLMKAIMEEEGESAEHQDFADARRQLGRFLDDVYNRKRIHSSLRYLTPAEFEQPWLLERSNEAIVS